MRTTVIAIASLAAGCSFSSNAAKSDSNTSHDGSGSGVIDAASDAPPDGPNMDFGPAPFTVHVPALPTAPLVLPGMINTDTDSHCDATVTWASNTQGDACFIVATSITSAGGATNVTGSRPLVVIATSTIDLTKPLNVASHRGATTTGAGGNFSMCDAFSASPEAGNGGGGGGGAGGTFMTQGGLGGVGDNGNANAGRPATSVSTPMILRGGCAGQKGGTANSGSAGDGGGALYLVAGQSITLEPTGTLNASGAGAAHGLHASGGSGGGSGGMIVLFAPTITATGSALIANGGGAASGGDQSSDGKDGADPAVATATTAASGGIGPGGNGGNGGVLTSGASGGGSGGSNQGGGGGGGGGGYIRSNVTLTGAIASPAADVVP